MSAETSITLMPGLVTVIIFCLPRVPLITFTAGSQYVIRLQDTSAVWDCTTRSRQLAGTTIKNERARNIDICAL
ncbi:hypothetical protein EV424DRAFT_1382768 [Suillus variegatus]|nr:hypothetical protein EV424DRAFT_1382768 [Suillus variegatus]